MLEMFDEKIEMLTAYKELYEMLEQRKSWYEPIEDCPYNERHMKAIEETQKAIKKLAGF